MRPKSIPFAILLVTLVVSFAAGQSSPTDPGVHPNVVVKTFRKRNT